MADAIFAEATTCGMSAAVPVEAPTTRQVALDATYEIEVLVNMLQSQREVLRPDDQSADDLPLQILLATTLRRIGSLNGFLMEALGDPLDEPVEDVFHKLVYYRASN